MPGTVETARLEVAGLPFVLVTTSGMHQSVANVVLATVMATDGSLALLVLRVTAFEIGLTLPAWQNWRHYMVAIGATTRAEDIDTDLWQCLQDEVGMDAATSDQST